MKLITPTFFNSGNCRVERTVRSVRFMVPEIEFKVEPERVDKRVALLTMSEPTIC